MKPITKQKGNALTKPTDNLREVANNVATRTNNAIKTGINNPKASNGTLMENIHGAAHTAATLKNIGKESNVNGGMNEGMNTILLNTKANSIIHTLDLVEKQQTFAKSIASGLDGDE